jgi:hypothetical protein
MAGKGVLDHLECRAFSDYRLKENCHRSLSFVACRRDITKLPQGRDSPVRVEDRRPGQV